MAKDCIREASSESGGLTDARDGRIPASRAQNQFDGLRGDILTWWAWSARLVSWVR